MDIIAPILVIILIIAFFRYKKKKKRERLMLKYNDIQLVNDIMAKTFWQGQTKEQLIDSIGKPLDINKQVYKTKTKETWKYQKTGSNRYSLKIIIENGIVVGWDKK